MTHLFLVRHGATVWHAENRYAGSSDVALDPNGYAQAERLAAWASETKLAAIWCSPLTRARETAAAAARATGLVPRADERLREIDFGQIEGKTMAEAEQLFPEEIRRFKPIPQLIRCPVAKTRIRLLAALCRLCVTSRWRSPTSACWSLRTTPIRLALCSVMGIPLARYRTVFPAVRNGALTEIRSRARTPLSSIQRTAERSWRRQTFNSPNKQTSSFYHEHRILVAGDHFILPSTFADAIRAE